MPIDAPPKTPADQLAESQILIQEVLFWTDRMEMSRSLREAWQAWVRMGESLLETTQDEGRRR